MINMAFGTARLGSVVSGMMTLAAHLDARDQDIRGLLAGRGLGVAGRALQHPVRGMMELRMGQPARGDRRFGYFRQRIGTTRMTQCMALPARLPP